MTIEKKKLNTAQTIFRLLTFRLTREEMLQFNYTHFALGLIGTWIVGMGRYWDDERAKLLQHLGVGSVIYIFVLSAFIWLIILPLSVEKWRYFTVLTFISLTSFPAILYAIPVEKFVTLETANKLNVYFLAIVAAWRLSLLYVFLKKFTDLSDNIITVVTLLPMCLIISMLTALNLHRAVFEIMGGLKQAPTAHDSAYFVLNVLTLFSFLFIVPLLLAYLYAIYIRYQAKQNSKHRQQSK